LGLSFFVLKILFVLKSLFALFEFFLFEFFLFRFFYYFYFHAVFVEKRKKISNKKTNCWLLVVEREIIENQKAQ